MGWIIIIVVVLAVIGYFGRDEFSKYVEPLEKKREACLGNAIALKKVFSEYETCFKKIKGNSFTVEGILIEVNILLDNLLKDFPMHSVENRRKLYNFSNYLKQVFDETELSYGLDNFFLAHGVADLPDKDFSVLGNYVHLVARTKYDYWFFGLMHYLHYLKNKERHFHSFDRETKCKYRECCEIGVLKTK